MIRSVDTVLAELDVLLDELAAATPGMEHAPEVLRVRNRIEAIATRCVRRVDRSGALDGAVSTASWVAWRCRIPRGRAKAMVSNGRALEVMSDVAAAFDHGAISSDHVRVLGEAQRFAPDAFKKAEPELLDEAERLRFDVFKHRVRYFRQLAEPDDVEDEATTLHDDRSFHASRTFQDCIRVDGTMEPVGGSIWLHELDRLERIEFEADWAEARARLGAHAASADLRRTSAQRRHDAAVEMAKRSAAMPGDAKQARYLLTVLVGYETLRGRICELADGTVLTPGQVLPLLSQADVERAVLGPDGRVLDLGRRARLFTGATRRAIEIGDLECTHESCDVRYERCDVDHALPWAAGGPTDRSNGRLRCPHHNPGRRRAPPSPTDA